MRQAAFAVIVSFALSLSAQTFDDAITVNVVDVPVYVERFGEPVPDLGRDDFELFVDGKPHPIEYFDVVDASANAAAPAGAGGVQAAPDLKRRRLIVLLFDTLAPHQVLQRARIAAAKYVDAGAPGDTFAVATAGFGGVLFIVPFTPDRVAVQRAIATLRPSAARDPFRVATLGPERDAWGGGHPGRVPPAVAGWYAGSALDMHAAQDDFSSRDMITSLADLADRLASLEGLKEVVLLSPGYATVEANTGAGTMHDITRMHARYREAGVILNAVDVTPLRAPGGAASLASPRPGPMMNVLTSPFLWTLAADTGGMATSSLADLQKRHRRAYVLGFRPPPSSEGRRHAVRVRVKNRPLLTDVRHRRSYTLDRPETDDGLFLADTLLNDIPQNGVTVDLDVSATSIAASIPGVELLSYASRGSLLRLDVYLYVFDTERRPVAWNRKDVTIDLEKGRDFLTGGPYTIREAVALPPGRYVVKALVRIDGMERIGFRRAELVVPAP